MNRFEQAAKRLASNTGYAVHVEWAPANREYVVDGYACSTIREARKIANRQKERMRRWNGSSWIIMSSQERM